MKKKLADVATKVPVELKNRLKRRAILEYTSESAIIRRALDIFLSEPTSKNVGTP